MDVPLFHCEKGSGCDDDNATSGCERSIKLIYENTVWHFSARCVFVRRIIYIEIYDEIF